MIQNLDVALNFQQRGSRWYHFANINGSVPAVLYPLILSSVVFMTHQTLLHVWRSTSLCIYTRGLDRNLWAKVN